ncbi:MAG: T9SS type A sorting domain-containing protein [Algibacter sp.]
MMKKITLLILMLLAFDFGFGQTTLSPGDIAITGFNSDNPDQFSFVLLTDVSNTTTINFTDNGWRSTDVFRTGEGTITWTANSDLTCGTQIIITDNSPFSASVGTVTDSGILQLATNGDQILAYQGASTSPTFIYAIHFDGAGWSTDATNPNTSAIPIGLTNGANAIAINDTDNATYDCFVISDAFLILSAVSDSSNWISSGSILTLGSCAYTCSSCSGLTTTWDGSSWNNGTPDITMPAIISGSYNTATDGGSFSACTLTVNSSGTIPEYTLTIGDGDFVEVQNDVISTGNILVQPQGAFVQNNDLGTVTATGVIEVEKETAPMDAWYEYTYWSSPVFNETLGDALAETEASRRFIFLGENYLDATAETGNNDATVTGQDDIDDNGDDWQSASGVMQPGIGYAATLSEFAYNIAPGTSGKQFKFTFEGLFNTGEVIVPIYRNDSETNDINFNLIGNPYPSAIDADLFLTANTNLNTSVTTALGIDGAIFLWSQNTPPSASANGNEGRNFSDSDYAVINGIGETAGGDGVTPNRFIPSGQAFFVTMANGATASLVSGDVYTADVTFNNSMRVLSTTDNSQFFKNTISKKNSSAITNKLWINLTSDNGVFNQTLVAYIDGATNNYDGAYFDAKRMASTVTAAILYTNIEDSSEKFAIQGRAANSLDVDEAISLGFKSNIEVATLFKLSVDHLEGDFLNENTVYIKDNLLNKLHDLSTSDYTFTTEVGEFNERFEIVFNANALSTDEAVLNTNKFSIVDLNSDRVQFNTNSNLNIKTIRVFDLLGRQLYDLKGHINSETYTLSNLNNAVYIAKIELSNGMVITKKAVKK